MAELLVRVRDKGPDPLGSDGDVFVALNDDAIGLYKAQLLAQPQNIGHNGDGLRDSGTTLHTIHEKTFVYRIERVSATEVDRVNIVTGGRERIGPPTMHVQTFIDRRLRRSQHCIFGTTGSEFWYADQKRIATADITALWSDYLSLHGHNRRDHQAWHWSGFEKRVYLALRVADFNESRRQAVLQRETERIDEGGEVGIVDYRLRARRLTYDWRNLTTVDSTEATNDAVETDHRTAAEYDDTDSTVKPPLSQTERDRIIAAQRTV